MVIVAIAILFGGYVEDSNFQSGFMVLFMYALTLVIKEINKKMQMAFLYITHFPFESTFINL